MLDDSSPPKYVAYGTAGFRDKAAVLPSVLYRVGLLAALRSRFFGGRTIGVMVTASHNPPEDNGAKLVDPLGEMLEESWEAWASELANADQAKPIIDRLYRDLKVDPETTCNVIYGRDTRESGPMLVSALTRGLEVAGAHVTNAGVLTTPQLHYLVRALNTLLGGYELESYGVPTQEGYYRKLATALRASLTASQVQVVPPYSIVVDCANGVGALKLRELAPFVRDLIEINIVNGACDSPELLNSDCGADFVKTQQRLPAGISESAPSGSLLASFDGDADRLIMYYISPETGEFRLMDGDKIASLAAAYLRDLVKETGAHIDIGVVQTAYANGASTDYITQTLGVPVKCTPTGVKHLHHEAQQFGIGIYFEANGHGTILFDNQTVRSLQQVSIHSPYQKRAIDTLLALSDLVNQTVGDAISDLLFVIATLLIKKWNPVQWDACYTDLPNRLLKRAVRDRTVFKTTNAERQLVEPADLQPKIDRLVSEYPRGRAFVRASGTEDVVRIYAEAASVQDCNALANRVSELLEPY